MVWTTPPLGTVNGQMPVGCLDRGKDVEALNWLLMV